jgi:hypothetical protein
VKVDAGVGREEGVAVIFGFEFAAGVVLFCVALVLLGLVAMVVGAAFSSGKREPRTFRLVDTLVGVGLLAVFLIVGSALSSLFRVK